MCRAVHHLQFLLQTAQGRGRDPDYETKANKKLRAYVEGHEFAIAEKAKIMIDHFQRDVHHLINGQAKAMVVSKALKRP